VRKEKISSLSLQLLLRKVLAIFEKKRVSFDFRKLFRKIYESENFVLIPLDYSILQKMVDLKDIPELHDKNNCFDRKIS